MKKHSIKFYPVENGDTTLINLKDGTTLMVDCKLRISAEDPDDATKYDVKKDLVESLLKRNNNLFTDVLILTHADKDHCHGFKKHFYSGNPVDYSDSNRSNNEIIIDELWVTSMLFSNVSDQSEDANAVRNEANRRIRMQKDHKDKNKRGNRIKLIGYDDSAKFEYVEAYVPGREVNIFNDEIKRDFSLFIHAPFKDTLITAKAEKDRNSSSIAFQARFKINSWDTSFAARILMGGDADHYVWQQILQKSKKHSRIEALKFDVFLAPHHCSWTYFNDVPYENNTTPKDYSLEILDYALPNAYIIASSRKVVNAKPNPPHYSAKEEYIKKLDNKNNFLNTAIDPTEEAPEPIEFIIESTGVKKIAKDKASAKSAYAGISSIGQKPYSY
jgi:hypothetical protein